MIFGPNSGESVVNDPSSEASLEIPDPTYEVEESEIIDLGEIPMEELSDLTRPVILSGMPPNDSHTDDDAVLDLTGPLAPRGEPADNSIHDDAVLDLTGPLAPRGEPANSQYSNAIRTDSFAQPPVGSHPADAPPTAIAGSTPVPMQGSGASSSSSALPPTANAGSSPALETDAQTINRDKLIQQSLDKSQRMREIGLANRAKIEFARHPNSMLGNVAMENNIDSISLSQEFSDLSTSRRF